MKEPDRIERNTQRVLELDIRHRAAFRRVLTTLESWGWRPRIQEAFRTDERQADLFARGRTELLVGGKHNRKLAGKPAAHAADILDDDEPLSENSAWYAHLACAAFAAGLETGALWGLSPEVRRRRQKLVEEFDRKELAEALRVKRGWDPCHAQVKS